MNNQGNRPTIDHRGTAQRDRRMTALMPDYALIDERSLADLLSFAAAYAKRINYFNERGENYSKDGEEPKDWGVFFERDISVFLAQLMVTDLGEADEKIQDYFLNIHQLSGHEKQGVNFTLLADAILTQVELMFSWYQKAKELRKWNDPTRIEKELNRALEGDLGWQLAQFVKGAELLEGLKTDEHDWLNRIEKLEKIWPFRVVQRDKEGRGWSLSSDDVDGQYLQLGTKLQDLYRRLYFTMAYILGIVPELFRESLENKNDHKPEIGLLLSFLGLFEYAQSELNTVTRRHLEYYYYSVLGQEKLPLQENETIVSLQLAEHLVEYLLPQGTLLSAGTTAAGLASEYITKWDLVVTRAKIGALKTIFLSKNPVIDLGSSYRLVTDLYAAPVADSADGLGRPFDGLGDWPILGEEQFGLAGTDRQMQSAGLGFAIATSTLILKEGEREVTVDLEYTGDSFANLLSLIEDMAENAAGDIGVEDVFHSVFDQGFRLFLSGAEGWIPVARYAVLPPEDQQWGQSYLRIAFTLPREMPAIVGYDPAVLGEGLDTQWPVLKVILHQGDNIYPYSFLRDLELEAITVKVKVKGLRNVVAYNELGLIDTSAPFFPFGPLPRQNSYLLMGNEELFCKRLNKVEFHLDWADLPDGPGGFSEHYNHYPGDWNNEVFRGAICALSDYLFKPEKAEDRETFPLFTTNYIQEVPLRAELSLKSIDLKRLGIQPDYALRELEPYSNRSRAGFFRLSIQEPKHAFGHALYPQVFARTLARQAQPRSFSLFGKPEEEELQLPNEPYTPLINRIAIDYEAESRIIVNPLGWRENVEKADEKVFRILPFGTQTIFAKMRSESTYLLPRFDGDAYLFIGLDSLIPPQTVSLFFDIQESKKRFEVTPLDLKWEYLRKDKWVVFESDQILQDTTVKLSTTGIIVLACPSDISLGNQRLDANLHWIRVSARGNLDILGRCRLVSTQAVEVKWVNNGDPGHLRLSPEERPPITDLKRPVSAITGLSQLLPFTEGKVEETDEEFYVRVSERLRHKNRAVNRWDYERMVLHRFPEVKQVKCIGRFGHEDYLDIGQLLLVLIPRIKEADPTPRIGFHILAEIEQYLANLSSLFAKVKVITPVYERVKITCKIKLKPKFEPSRGKIWRELHESIKHHICPWLKDGTLGLGGNVSKNDILTIIKDNPCVSFVTAFSMVQVYEEEKGLFALEDTARKEDSPELLTASRPWSVLVPVEQHQITFMEEEEYQQEQIAAIDRMRLETDFVVLPEDENPIRPLSDSDNGDEGGNEDDDEFWLPEDWLR